MAGALAFATLAGVAVTSSADAAVFQVTNRADAGSLRDAITAANAAAGADDIQFAIPGGGPNRHVIHLVTDLPPITDVVDVRGYSQPGAVRAQAGVPALIKIVIDAGQVSNGLVLQTDDSRVRGLVIHTASGAAPDGDGLRVEGDRNRVDGNYLGLDGTNNANFLFGNDGEGLEVTGDDNLIGGTAPEDRNVIAANGKIAGTAADGVSVTGDDNTIKGNAIGTDPTMTNGQIGNSEAGIRLTGDRNKVGGASLGAGNVISGNGTGVHVVSGTDNELKGNLIGTDAAGTLALATARAWSSTRPAPSSATPSPGPATSSRPRPPARPRRRERREHRPGQQGRHGRGGHRRAGQPRRRGGERVRQRHRGRRARRRQPRLRQRLLGHRARRAGDGNRVQGNLFGTDAGGLAPLPNTGDGIRAIGADDPTTSGACFPGRQRGGPQRRPGRRAWRAGAATPSRGTRSPRTASSGSTSAATACRCSTTPPTPTRAPTAWWTTPRWTRPPRSPASRRSSGAWTTRCRSSGSGSTSPRTTRATARPRGGQDLPGDRVRDDEHSRRRGRDDDDDDPVGRRGPGGRRDRDDRPARVPAGRAGHVGVLHLPHGGLTYARRPRSPALRGGLGARPAAELREDVAHVHVDRARAEHTARRRSRGSCGRGDQAHDLELAARQAGVLVVRRRAPAQPALDGLAELGDLPAA